MATNFNVLSHLPTSLHRFTVYVTVAD